MRGRLKTGILDKTIRKITLCQYLPFRNPGGPSALFPSIFPIFYISAGEAGSYQKTYPGRLPKQITLPLNLLFWITRRSTGILKRKLIAKRSFTGCWACRMLNQNRSALYHIRTSISFYKIGKKLISSNLNFRHLFWYRLTGHLPSTKIPAC